MNYLSRMAHFSKALCLSFLFLMATSVSSFAQSGSLAAWTSVGSVGTVDEADNGKIGFSLQQAYLTPNFNTALIRYNVTATDGLFAGPNDKLAVRFFKPDADTRPIINLARD